MHGRFVARPCVFFRSGFSDLFIPYHFSISRNMRAIQRIEKLEWHFIATLHSKYIFWDSWDNILFLFLTVHFIFSFDWWRGCSIDEKHSAEANKTCSIGRPATIFGCVHDSENENNSESFETCNIRIMSMFLLA